MVSDLIRPDGSRILARHFDMTKDGFVFLVMGFKGSKTDEFKRRYIDEFNRMAAKLVARSTQPTQPQVPQTFAEALRLAADQQGADRPVGGGEAGGHRAAAHADPVRPDAARREPHAGEAGSQLNLPFSIRVVTIDDQP